jgi:hypothetical protein
MNEPASPIIDSDLDQQVAALQRQVFLLLVALIVVTATLVSYLFYQSHVLNSELADTKPAAQQFIMEFNKNALAIQNFDRQLGEYGLKHPAFQPILKKYGWTPSASSGARTTAPAR